MDNGHSWSIDGDTVFPVSQQVATTVQRMEVIARCAPYMILVLCWIIPVLIGFMGGLAVAIAVGAGMALVSTLVTHILMTFFVDPSRLQCYRNAASLLAAKISDVGGEMSVARHTWSDPVPGVIAILPDATLVLADEIGGYAFLHMPITAICSAMTIVGWSQSTGPRRTTSNISGNGTRASGGASSRVWLRPTARTIETAKLQLRYRFPDHAPLRVAVIPFGENLRAAQEFRVALVDLHAQTLPSSKVSSLRSFR